MLCSSVTSMAPGASIENGTVTINGDLNRNLKPNAYKNGNGKTHKVIFIDSNCWSTCLLKFTSENSSKLSCFAFAEQFRATEWLLF